jgi:hypothetical protein
MKNIYSKALAKRLENFKEKYNKTKLLEDYLDKLIKNKYLYKKNLK